MYTVLEKCTVNLSWQSYDNGARITHYCDTIVKFIVPILPCFCFDSMKRSKNALVAQMASYHRHHRAAQRNPAHTETSAAVWPVLLFTKATAPGWNGLHSTVSGRMRCCIMWIGRLTFFFFLNSASMNCISLHPKKKKFTIDIIH